eukprot:3565319-Rhodomonas_salina.1
MPGLVPPSSRIGPGSRGAAFHAPSRVCLAPPCSHHSVTGNCLSHAVTPGYTLAPSGPWANPGRHRDVQA